MVLVRTEFGRTIGGFTRYKWDTNKGYLHDKGRHSFLFSLDLKLKMEPNKQLDGKDLMYCGSGWGPWFGGGSGDLGLSDQCNQN